MQVSAPESHSDSRLPTGVPGLDEVLNGGLPNGHLFLIEGEPGAGKTTLGLQFLLEGVRRGERVLYMSLSESTSEIRQIARSHGWSLEGMNLFEYSAPQQNLQPEEQYSVFHPSDVEFFDATQSLLAEVKRIEPSRIVLDSLSEIRLLAGDSLRYRRQVLALKQYFTSQERTVLVLDDGTADVRDLQVHSIAHGVILLENVRREYGKDRRRMRVSKMRGSTYREGFHDYTIKAGGVRISPRLSSSNHPETVPQGTAASDIAELDRLFGGGLDRGSATLLIGPAGSGKSSIALAYATAAARRQEHVAVFLFEELIDLLCRRGAGLGMDPKPLMDSGFLSLRKVDPAEISPAEFVEEVRSAVSGHGATTIVIDSLNGLLQAMPNEENLVVQFHEMLAFLNQRGVVTILVLAQSGVMGSGTVSPVDMSYLTDNILLFRFFEAAGRVRKAVSVVKKRSGAHEDTIRELTLAGGVQVGEALTAFRGVLTGVPEYVGEESALRSNHASNK